MAYVGRIVSFADIGALKSLKILVNAGHGTAGPTFDAIVEQSEEHGAAHKIESLFHEPDRTFPQGIPNPLLTENRPKTAQAVRDAGADFGVAWDGDFDRCFFFDNTGAFIDGEYLVGLLAEAFLAKDPSATIIHDPRVIWNTQNIVEKAKGRAVQTRTGHAFIKQAMREENAVYGGEVSAHHYFRDFVHCESGMVPWILMSELVSRHGSLNDLVAHRKAAFTSSGEINFTLEDPKGAIERVQAVSEPQATAITKWIALGSNLAAGDLTYAVQIHSPLSD